MDQDNPAVNSLTKMPPALLADVADDPSILKGIATVMSAVQLEGLHRVFNNPATPTGQKIQIFEATSKIAEIGAYGKASQPQVTPGTGFSVNIIFDNTPKPDAASKAKTIDVVATEIVDVKDTANV